MRNRLRRRRAAFSLVELLVVLGLIALLLGILLPSLARARVQGRKVACKARLHDLGAAVQMYLNQHDGRYPPAPYSPEFNPLDRPIVSDYLRPYVSTVNADLDPVTGKPVPHPVFTCPADEVYAPKWGLSYSYYEELGVRRMSDTFFWKVLAAGGGSASLIPVLWDAEDYHGGGVPFNWLMADGHVEPFLKGVPDVPDEPPPDEFPETTPDVQPPPGVPNP